MPSTLPGVAVVIAGAYVTFAAFGAFMAFGGSAFVAVAPQPSQAKLSRSISSLAGASLRGADMHKEAQSWGSSAFTATSAMLGMCIVGAAAKRKRNSERAAVTREAVGMGINGFGRIGRQVARIASKDPDVDLKLINASYDADYMAYLMKYDTIHGKYDGTIEADGDSLVIDGHRVALSHTRNPAEIPFGKNGADYACESTGVFLTAEKAQSHLEGGAKKVIFSAPAKDDSHTIVMGVNEGTYDPAMQTVSCASCTTNGLAPAVRALHEKFGIKRGLMTTCHAMTATQPTVDSNSKKDWRGGRAGPGNIIPSSTGAAKAVGKVLPEMNGKLTGMSLRVPTMDVSVVDLTIELNTPTTYEEICDEIKRRAEGDMSGILGYTEEPLVSSDFETCPISCVFDASAGIMLDPTFVKVILWYDNEWAYSNRVVDLVKHMAAEDAKA